MSANAFDRDKAGAAPTPGPKLTPPRADLRTEHRLLRLQRTAGNQAVASYVQRDSKSLEARVASLEQRMNQQKWRTDTILVLEEFESKVTARGHDWHQAARVIGSAYGLAAQRHRAALEAQERTDAVIAAVMFSVLAAATGGGLGWVAGTVLGSYGRLASSLTDAADLTRTIDIAKGVAADLGRAGVAGLRAAHREPARPSSHIPLDFQNELANQVDATLQQHHTSFATLYKNLRQSPMDGFTADTAAVVTDRMRAWMADTDTLAGAAELPSEDDMADELERGIWARWAPNLRDVHHIRTGPGPANLTRVMWNDPGDPLSQRFHALGIAKASGADDVGWLAAAVDDREAELLYNYLSTYEVKKFLDTGG